MVEREHDVRILDSTFQGCVEGRGGILVISGPTGRGKTTLLHTFAERCLEADALVMYATGSRVEQTLPLGVLDQLFQSVSQYAEYNERVVELLDVGTVADTLAARSTDKADEVAELCRTLSAAVLREISNRPVVLIVDDVHYADESSLRALLFLARRMKFTRVLLVLAEQDHHPHREHSVFRAELFRQPHCRRLRLPPLSVHGVRQLLAEELGDEQAQTLAPALHAATGGNPLLVRALREDWIRLRPGTMLPSDDQLSCGAFGEAVVDCLHRGDPLALQVANTAAVLGEGSSPELISAMLETDVEGVRHCIGTLNSVGLLSGWRFSHHAAELAVLKQVEPDARRRIRIRMAARLHEDGAPRQAVAQSLITAGGPLPAWSVEVLRRTAEDELRLGRTDAARQCLELAHGACKDVREQGALATLLAVLEWRSDPSAPLRRFPMLRESLRHGLLSQYDAATFLRLLLRHGDMAEAEEILARFGDLMSPDDPAELGEIRFVGRWLECSHPRLARRFPAIGLISGEPVNSMSVSVSPHYQAAEVLAAAFSHESADIIANRAEQLLESCPLNDSTLEPFTVVLSALIHANLADMAASWCDVLVDRAGACGAPTWRAVFCAKRAEIALRQGDLSLARERGRDALRHIPQEQWGISSYAPLPVLLRATTEMGRLDEAARLVRQAMPQSVLETRTGLDYLQARGHFYLARGWPHTARNDFQLCGELMAEWGMDPHNVLLWRLDLAGVYLQLGQADRARALAQEHLGQTPAPHTRARGMGLGVLAAAGDPVDRPALLTRAADELGASDDQLERARVLTDLAYAYAGTRDIERARRTGEQALDLALRCQADPLVRRASLLLERDLAEFLGDCVTVDDGQVDSDPIAVLSDSERRVAALASQGNSNRQIARRLFITVSTVEQHLTSTYRKLKVNRRAELPSGLETFVVDSV
ncbi:AAA family ATPase [Streptomyces sp. NPDC056500]|uniref:helix-turn-helix transcriptional regulator n=1 Tax=Streptomyces sp. NPDC056500 TaxID=3345840 RepID=UPI003676878C